MILIQSSRLDYSTSDVVKWLLNYKASFIRVNGIAEIIKIECLNNSVLIQLKNGLSFNLKEVKTYWYRRGEFQVNFPLMFESTNEEFDEKHKIHLYREYEALLGYFLRKLKIDIKGIGDSTTCMDVNKLIVHEKAESVGLNVPTFIVTTQKREVIKFIEKHPSVVSKTISNMFLFGNESVWYPTYTQLITTQLLNEMTDHFLPTLFQKYIEKKYEIRSFYLDGNFYSMAIFSQNDPQTKIDFRVYNHEKWNRNVPYKLPKNIEDKLRKLMKEMKFESGSIDLIYSANDEYYFLEVNPVGQFGMVSYPCNYNLEKKIALSLIKKSTKSEYKKSR